MEIAEKKTWHDIDVTGNWVLDYKCTNPMGPSAFGGKHLAFYKNPFTKEKTYLKGPGGEPKAGFMIDKIQIKLYPDLDPEHKSLVSWLICHPEVQVLGVKGLDETILKSKLASKVELTCKDYVEISDIEEEDFIDRLNGLLSLDGGKQAIGLEKLRYILARTGQTYHEPRFEGMAEKKFLRSKLKSYVRSSYENAKDVSKAIDDMEGSKDYFEFKEMLRVKIIVSSNSLYKFNGTPLGANYDSVRLFFDQHPEVKMECTKQLYAKIG